MCISAAARLNIRCDGGLAVRLEEQLHHLERRALGNSVVEWQLPVLRGISLLKGKGNGPRSMWVA